jgi:hypothetical protein
MAARELARNAARRVAPGYMADRARRFERGLRARKGMTDLARRLVAEGDPCVQAGPFAGMAYPRDRIQDIDAAVAKLLGTYEQEIAWVFQRAVERQVRTFIDIGCADGYYAAGIAHASPTTTTFAYDLAPSARDLCAQTAAASGVEDRVRIGKQFTVGALAALPAERALVLCDIEGGEVELLDSGAAAALRSSLVVVEVHEDERPGAGERLTQAFAGTHDAVTVRQQPRSDVPAPLADWTPDECARALSEFRGPDLYWIVFEPKAG